MEKTKLRTKKIFQTTKRDTKQARRGKQKKGVEETQKNNQKTKRKGRKEEEGKT